MEEAAAVEDVEDGLVAVALVEQGSAVVEAVSKVLAA